MRYACIRRRTIPSNELFFLTVVLLLLTGCTVGGVDVEQEQASVLAGELLTGHTFGQTFTLQYDGLYRIDLYTATYIDPKQNKADRHWHFHTIDLSAYAGQTVTLIFETGTGPAGDYRYDWAGWGEPRLLKP